MRTRKPAPPPILLFLLLSILFFIVISTRLSRTAEIRLLLNLTSHINPGQQPAAASTTTFTRLNADHDFGSSIHRWRSASSFSQPLKLKHVSILLPAWEVLLVVHPEVDFGSTDDFHCLFPNNQTSPARFVKVLPFSKATAFKCILPMRNRRMPYHQPVLIIMATSEIRPLQLHQPAGVSSTPELLIRWNFLVYEAFSTPHDVVLFVKGVNNRQGVNRLPEEFECVFDYGGNSTVKTAVTSSVQEVFRCHHPNLTVVNSLRTAIKVSLEISARSLVMPSVAYYRSASVTSPKTKKSLLCASTMIYNAAKFLREWVIYHSKIGVQKFVLYDNDSDDETERVIDELNQQGYNIETIFWVWPKTQEAGFSHSAVYAKDSCSWVMYVDVDEFVFSPNWLDSPKPSIDMLPSLLPVMATTTRRLVGQMAIKCNDFGPSGQTEHPAEGVTQGYTCRRLVGERHKSIVLLEAVETSLVNVIHHFTVNQSGYETKEVGVKEVVVNHYKYQAWPEFKKKFRRRVSAYVVDWTKTTNPGSKDRTPGLGFEAMEPKGWPRKFCEVNDQGLKVLTRKWFASRSPTAASYRMAWQQ